MSDNIVTLFKTGPVVSPFDKPILNQEFEDFKARAISQLEELIGDIKDGGVEGIGLAVRQTDIGARNKIWYDALNTEALYFTVGFLQHTMMTNDES